MYQIKTGTSILRNRIVSYYFYLCLKLHQLNKVTRYIIIGIIAAGIVAILWYFKNIVAYILISSVLSLVGGPVVSFLGKLHIKNIRMPRGLCALFTLLLLWVLFITFLRVFIPLIANQANELSQINVDDLVFNLESPLEKIEELYNKYTLNPGGDVTSLEARLHEYLVSLFSFSMVSNLFSSVAGTLGNIFVAAFSISFITFFFLKESKMFSDAILTLVPVKYEQGVAHALESTRRLLMRYFLGIGMQVTGIIILVTTGMTIIGIGFRQGLVIGLLAGIMNIIPYIGPLIGSVIGIILGVATHLDMAFYSEILPLIGYMILVFVVVQVTDNVLFQPLIYSSSVDAHPMEIFLVIMIAGSMAGIIGMVLAIPSYTVLRVFAKEFFNHLKVVKKLTKKIT